MNDGKKKGAKRCSWFVIFRIHILVHSFSRRSGVKVRGYFDPQKLMPMVLVTGFGWNALNIRFVVVSYVGALGVYTVPPSP